MSAALKKTTGSAGVAAPGLLGVVVVVQPDAHDLADPRHRRPDAHPGVVERGQHTGVGRGPYPVQGELVGEQLAVDVRHQAGQVPQGPVGVEQRRTLFTGVAYAQQLHGQSPLVERGPADG